MEHHDIFGRRKGAERTKENQEFAKKVYDRLAKSKALEAKKVEGKGEGKVAKGNEGKGGKDKRTQITNKFKEV